MKVIQGDKTACLLLTECQSSFILASYWLRAYNLIVENLHCLPSNITKRSTSLLTHRSTQLQGAMSGKRFAGRTEEEIENQKGTKQAVKILRENLTKTQLNELI